MRSDKAGFTILEIMLVILIIGLLSTIAFVGTNSARKKARDAVRVADVSSIQKALLQYFGDKEGYPVATGLILGETGASSLCGDSGFSDSCVGKKFMGLIPAAPTPYDGGCSAEQNRFTYSSEDGKSFTVEFCTGTPFGSLPPGVHEASDGGLK